jgi:ribose-phosphate pyrophosphokinase
VFGKIKVFSGSTHRPFSEAICGHLGLPLGKSHVVRFSNDNMLVQIDENVREADVFVVQTTAPPVSDAILELLIFIDALKHASAARVTAVLPYFPYARSDKKDKPRISITARLMADLLQTAGADRVLTMDLHAPQIQGFFRIPADQLSAVSTLCAHLKAHRDLSNTVLVAGDIGESKEVGRFANRLNLPVAIIDKRRKGDDEKPVATHLIGDVQGKRAIVIDDEIASGGTVLQAAEFVLARGAVSVEAAATHGVLSGHAAERLSASRLERLVVSDTVPVPDATRLSKLEIVSVTRLFANAIQAIHDGESVSALFT